MNLNNGNINDKLNNFIRDPTILGPTPIVEELTEQKEQDTNKCTLHIVPATHNQALFRYELTTNLREQDISCGSIEVVYDHKKSIENQLEDRFPGRVLITSSPYAHRDFFSAVVTTVPVIRSVNLWDEESRLIFYSLLEEHDTVIVRDMNEAGCLRKNYVIDSIYHGNKTLGFVCKKDPVEWAKRNPHRLQKKRKADKYKWVNANTLSEYKQISKSFLRFAIRYYIEKTMKPKLKAVEKDIWIGNIALQITRNDSRYKLDILKSTIQYIDTIRKLILRRSNKYKQALLKCYYKKHFWCASSVKNKLKIPKSKPKDKEQLKLYNKLVWFRDYLASQ